VGRTAKQAHGAEPPQEGQKDFKVRDVMLYHYHFFCQHYFFVRLYKGSILGN